MADTPRELVGQALAGGRYQLVARLGEGGMGTVYRAYDRNLGTDVVVKIPRHALFDDPEFAERFQREIRALVNLTHPNIVHITDVGMHDERPFAIMQFLSGGSLDERRPVSADGSPRPGGAETFQVWLPAVAAALDFAHRRGYVHRDVKPANVLFDAAGHAFLSDFGIAKVLAADEAARKTLTGTGMVMGTPEYMAPEVIMGEAIDGRADQYALGVMLYEWLAGRRPFDGPTPASILVQHTTKEPPPLAAIRPDLPEALTAAVHRALAKDPNQRYPDCMSLSRAVAQATPAQVVAAGEAVRLTCPNCGRGLRVPEKARGRVARCPGCQKQYRVSGGLDRLEPIDAAGANSLPEIPLAETLSVPARSSGTVAAVSPAAGRRSQPPAPATPGGSSGQTPAATIAAVAATPSAPKAPARDRRLVLAGAAGAVVLVAGGIAALLLSGGEPTPALGDRQASARTEPARQDAAATSGRSTANPAPIEPADHPGLEEARRRLALENLGGAEASLNEYLASPAARRSAEARTLLDEIDLARSEDAARNKLRSLSDSELNAFARFGRLASAPSFSHAGLEQSYRENLRRFLDEEQSQRLPRIASKKAATKNGPRRQPQPQPEPEPPAESPSEVVQVPIERLLASPDEFDGRIIFPTEYLLIGTKMEQPTQEWFRAYIKDRHGKTLARPTSRIEPTGVNLVIVPGLAARVRERISANDLTLQFEPVYKCVPTIELRRIERGGGTVWLGLIVGLDILCEVNFYRIATNQENPVRCVSLGPANDPTPEIDENGWIERLGGGEFTSRVRREAEKQLRSLNAQMQRNQVGSMIGKAARQTIMEGDARERAFNEQARRIFGR
jgi:tRNA A-37 threonylcarbamoyl transferase component Bud32